MSVELSRIALRNTAASGVLVRVPLVVGVERVYIQLVRNSLHTTSFPSPSSVPIVAKNTVVAVTTDAIYLVVKVRRSPAFGAWLDVYVTILNSIPPFSGILFST